jgi:hypothetical protein
MRPVRLFLVLAAIHTGAATAAPAQDLAYTGSLQFASGSYIFTESTRTLSVYNGITWNPGRVRLTGSIPVILHNSGALTLVGGAYVPTGGTGHGVVGGRTQGQKVPMGPGGPNRSVVAGVMVDAMAAAEDSTVQTPGRYEVSVGDPLVSAGLELFRGLGLVRSLELTATAKPPINDLESGVGTGEWDVGAGGATVLGIGRVLAFLDVAYWRYGDLAELELRDGASWAGGLAVPLTRVLSATVFAAGTNRIIATADPALSMAVGLSYRGWTSGSASGSAGGGLSETAADVTASVGWRRVLR